MTAICCHAVHCFDRALGLTASPQQCEAVVAHAAVVRHRPFRGVWAPEDAYLSASMPASNCLTRSAPSLHSPRRPFNAAGSLQPYNDEECTIVAQPYHCSLIMM
eukprot:scaffold46320_cov21-Tisochrysis_lutea.AAC.2